MSDPVLKNKQQFILFDFVFWLVLAVIFPAVSGHFNFINIVNIVIYLSAVYYLGELLLHKVDAIRKIPFLFKSGIYIIFGGIVCGLIFLLIPSGIIVYGLTIIFILDVIVNRRIEFSFSFKNFLCLIPFLVILFQTYELAYATTERYNFFDGDFYFYSAITESIKTTHNVRDAVFHTGLPINYAVLPFLAPAHLAHFAGIPSQFALWGVYGKLVPVVCLGTFSYVIAELSVVFFGSRPAGERLFKRQLLASFMLLLLGPLHFLNLAKFDFKNVLFLGEGYLLPIGSPGFSLGMFVSGVVLLLVFQTTRWPLVHKIAIIGMLTIIAASKVAMFLPLVALLGLLSVLRLFKKDYTLFFVLLAALPFCVMVFLLTSGAKDATVATQLTWHGYYQEYFITFANKYGINGSPFRKILIMFGISFFMWLFIKLLILIIAGFNLYKKNFAAVSLLVAVLFGCIISFLPGFFVNAYGRDGAGKFLFDARFDMDQFSRGGIFLVTVVAAVFVVYFVFDYKKLWVRKFSLTMVCLYMGIISMSFITNVYEKPPVVDKNWYQEVQADYNKIKPKLMAMISSGKYCGQVVTTAGVHPWYCTGLRSDGAGHIMSSKAYERNIVFQKIFDTTLSLTQRKNIADSIKKLGVDCIVGSPNNMQKIKAAEKDSLVSFMNGTKWLYNLN